MTMIPPTKLASGKHEEEVSLRRTNGEIDMNKQKDFVHILLVPEPFTCKRSVECDLVLAAHTRYAQMSEAWDGQGLNSSQAKSNQCPAKNDDCARIA